MTSYIVLGREVEMPVQVRRSRAAMGVFSVDAAAAQRTIDYSGHAIRKYRPNRGLCALTFIRYEDGDLGPYNEFGVVFPVSGGVLIHRLPVDGEFTMMAGRQIWGFPKELADFDVSYGSKFTGRLSQHGQEILRLDIAPGIRAPGAIFARPLDAFSCLNEVSRTTSWTMTPGAVRTRPGGARLSLGDHPLAHELRGLGLGRRALLTTHMPRLRMEFGDAVRTP
ncbi:acetoacetate decarboxylase family protein [Rhodococcus sp. H36-A4]|uniref:acetoacetate decarboxylase family protein n=1 Tax=Rhodococcus sp. H36-A4 TaxID=3004353 RepID=UPI0022B0303B|nr:acetoacetate decarboxylase family protein [Rhodococcus sp. H36-A4]MCZ4077996.1 acetoacetate decarboxylase family protein [Rhodococcus sp. H36-A4]